MKQIRLQELTLRNFKGVKEFKFPPNGENANVFGDNEKGKTRLYDSFLWTFFDKDSYNKKDFEVRTLDEFNNPEHHQINEVSAKIEVDGQNKEFTRRMSEDWSKRGPKKLKGFKYEYFIDGDEVTKTEYTKAVKNIIDEETFKLLTNPRYFNEHLKWEKRRETVIEVVGDATVNEILAQDPSLSALEGIKEPKDVIELRAKLKKKQNKVNDEKIAIPIQIKEAQRQVDALPDESVDTLKKKKADLEKQVAAKQKEIATIGRPEGQVENLKKAMEIEWNMQAERNIFETEKREKCRSVRKEIDACDTTLAALARKKAGYQADIERWDGDIKSCMNQLEELRLQWISKNAETLPPFENDDTCPTCKQALPCDMIEASRAKAIFDFNLEKSQTLERIAATGNGLKADLEGIKKQKAKAETDLKGVEKDIDHLETSKANFGKQLAVFEADEFKKDESTLEEIARLRQESPDDIAVERDKKTLQAVLAHIQDELQAVSAGILAHESAEKTNARIDELKAQEKTLAAEFEALEEQLFLCEKFTRIRVKMLEDKIASKFKIARFKMFHDQINEGVKDCCETLYNGVPYGNMNNASRINIGLDIISTLIGHYGVLAPIFVDNAESVTALYPVPAQTIRLIVSEGDKVLKCGDENSLPTPPEPRYVPDIKDDGDPIEELERSIRSEIINNL